jgi:hypothetical protein
MYTLLTIYCTLTYTYELDWFNLLERIRDEKCIPFLGAGAAVSWLPLSRDIAIEWAQRYEYPGDDKHSLQKVAQFLAIHNDDSLFPKFLLAKALKRIQVPDFSLPVFSNTIYTILAELNLPLYLTTNYDHLLENALRAKGKDPLSEICVWNEHLEEYLAQTGFKSVFTKGSEYRGDPDHPLVYHVHGDMDDPHSMVLTEEDYLNFLTYFHNNSLPSKVLLALTHSTKLYLGYSLTDMNLNVILRTIPKGAAKKDMAIILLPSGFEEIRDEYVRYLDRYYNEMFNVKAYFGNMQTFGEELQKRWYEYKTNNVIP